MSIKYEDGVCKQAYQKIKTAVVSANALLLMMMEVLRLLLVVITPTLN